MLSYYRFNAIWICFVAGFFCVLQFLLQGSTGLMVESLTRELSIDLKDIGFLSSAFFYPYILLQIPAGFLVDKYGPRWVLIVACVLLSLGAFLFSCCQTCLQADLARMVMGAGSALGVLACMGLAIVYFPLRFVLVAGFFEMMALFGGALGDIWFEPLVEESGWRLAMQTCSFLVILILVNVFLFVKLPKNTDAITVKTQSNKPDVTLSSGWQIARLFANRWVWRSCLYGGFLFAIINTFAALWSVHFLKLQHPENTFFAATATGWIFIGGAVGTLFVGVLYRYLSLHLVMKSFSMVALFSFLFVLWGGGSYFVIKCALFLLGFSTGSYILAFEEIKNRVPKSIQNSAVGLTNMIILLFSGPVMQPLLGELFEVVNLRGDTFMWGVGYRAALLPLMLGLLFTAGLSFCRERREEKSVHLGGSIT